MNSVFSGRLGSEGHGASHRRPPAEGVYGSPEGHAEEVLRWGDAGQAAVQEVSPSCSTELQ